ncbi:MAG: response regulator [Deltaproteobacteria bacterium]|nr:response regulator [Deltaproteobacteria bacterium]
MNDTRESSMSRLHIINGQMEGRCFELNNDTTFVGRSFDNDIRIKDKTISQNHVKIIRKDKQFFIEDLRSKNGTRINGHLINSGDEIEIKEGDCIAMGNIFITLGKPYSEDGMVAQYSINLADQRGESREGSFYKDRRVTSPEKLELLYEVSTILMQSLEIDEICEKIMDSLFYCLKRIDSGAVLLIDPETGELKQAIARSGINKKNIKMNYSRTIVNRVFTEGKAVMMSDTGYEDPSNLSESIEMMHIKSIMCVPLISKSGTRGVIYVHSINLPKGFRKDDLFFLTVLSTPVALAIENALLYRERQRSEEALQRARDELELRIKERTTERKQFQKGLIQSQKMEALGALAGGISHDFNNLLMGIQGRTSLMLVGKDSSHPEFEHLKGIEDYVNSATALTKQLLGFARGGKYEVKPADLNELIKKQNRMFGRTKKEITIRGTYKKNLWTVEIDQGQIEQVLLNLYINAWQSMPGGGELHLETENVVLDENYAKPFKVELGEYVKVSVTDTGVGMDEATRRRIFEPFFTTKEMGRGTGLGLASVYGIIKNHGGFINVYSEKGEGSTFNIYLPASEKKIVEETELDKEVLEGTEMVLFIDDEGMIIDVGKQLLEKMGYTVLVARSGKEAIETYKGNKDKISMTILDMVMPGMSGGEAYDKLKDINPDIKVLLSSGYSRNSQATEILDRGCNGFIQKPFSMKGLSQKLREILDKD